MESITDRLARVLFSASMVARSFTLLLVVCTIALGQFDPGRNFGVGQAGPEVGASKPRGLHLYRVSSSGSYFTHANPVDQSAFRLGVPFKSDVFTQTSATVGWSLPGRASDLTIIYSPTYNRSTSYPEWNRLNHFVSLHGRAGKPVKKFGRWSLDVSAKGDASNFESFLFTPMALSQSASSPGTLDDLRGLISQRQFVSGEIASAITNVSAIAEAPAQLLFYGTQMLSASAVASLQYSYSPRTSFQVMLDGLHFQPLYSNSPRGVQNFDPMAFRSTSVGASVGMNHSVNPRTTFSWTADSKRVFSPAMDAYTTTTSIALNRTIGRRWFVDGRAGVGFIHPVLATPVPQGLQYAGGGSLGYKMRSHTLLVDVTRSVSEALMFGASSSIAYSAAWRWQPVRSRWSFDAAIGRQKIDGITAGTLNNWRAHARLSRMIGPQFVIYSQYSGLSYEGNLNLQRTYRINSDGVQFSLVWLPLPNLFRR